MRDRHSNQKFIGNEIHIFYVQPETTLQLVFVVGGQAVVERHRIILYTHDCGVRCHIYGLPSYYYPIRSPGTA